MFVIWVLENQKFWQKIYMRTCEWKCKFDERKCDSNQKWNHDKCWCERKKHNICDKDYIWNPATYTSIVDDHSVITCDEIIRETKTVPTNFNEKK